MVSWITASNVMVAFDIPVTPEKIEPTNDSDVKAVNIFHSTLAPFTVARRLKKVINEGSTTP
jgi:hypothetical protein